MRLAAKARGEYREFPTKAAAEAHSRKQSAIDAAITEKKYARKAGTKKKAGTLQRRPGY
jgi:hypothetical protein